MNYVYKYLDINRHCIYVGVTCNIERIQREHLRTSKHRHYIETILYTDIIDRDLALLYEKAYIIKLQPKYSLVGKIINY